MAQGQRRFIDIGLNLTDPMFRGNYHGKQRHPDDYDAVLQRAWDTGMDRIMVTAGRLQEVHQALELCNKDARLFTTAGCHPTRSGEVFSRPKDASMWDDALGALDDGRSQRYIDALEALAAAHPGKIVAVGECGLDYDRLHFSPKDVQQRVFELHFDLAERLRLPMFLHDRNTGHDFIETVRRHRGRFVGGVVHSFTGTWEEAEELLSLGLSLGVNGCSLKTEENLKVAARIPAERLMLETDGPWCGIKNTHASAKYVKTTFQSCKAERFVPGATVRDRTEPCHIVQVLEVLAAVRNTDADTLAQQCYNNTMAMFFPGQ